MKWNLLVTGLICTALLSACGGSNHHNELDAHYWQRQSVSDAAYQRGQLAQEDLNRDIAKCVTEIHTLQNLGQIKNGFPVDGKSRQQMAFEKGDRPPVSGSSIDANGNITDFESCMVLKGWERINYVPYDTAHRAQNNYVSNLEDSSPAKRKHSTARNTSTKKQMRNCDHADFCNDND